MTYSLSTYSLFMRSVFAVALLLSAASLGAQTNRYLPIRLPSYNAVSILDHLKTPRGQYTGIPEISVPITTVESRKLSLPVTLHYHAGGVRVNTLASWVGLNWSLDAGGVIIRVPYGGVDSYELDGGMQSLDDQAEPDLYYFQVAGISGKFFCHGASAGKLQFVTMPRSNLKVSVELPQGTSQEVLSFKLTDDGGNQYVFARQERTRLTVNGAEQGEEVLAWYLTKIVPGTYGDEITLEYTTYTTGIHYVGHSAVSAGPGEKFFTTAAAGSYATDPGNRHANSASACTNCPVTAATQLDTARLSMRITSGARLSRINFVNGRVDFLVDPSPREDLADDRRLRYIEVYSIYDGETRLISRHELVHSYFSASCSPATSEKRLRLDRVKQWYNGLWSTPPNPTQSIDTWFTYDDSQCLPRRSSYAQDLWGYWNGQSPTTLAAGLATTNRSLGTLAVRRVGSLVAVNTQMGARTKYTYEGHKIAGGTPVGGLRLRSVEVQPNAVDGASDNIVRFYQYRSASDTSSSGVIGGAAFAGGAETGFAHQVYQVLPTAVGCTPPASNRLGCGVWLRGTFTRYDVMQESHIEYGSVLENRGSQAGVNGRTVSEYITQAFSSASEDAGSTGYRGTPPTFRDWRRGMTRRVELLDMADSLVPKAVSRSTSTFQFLTTTGAGFTFHSATGNTGASYVVAGNTYNLSGTYTLESGWFNAQESLSESWAQDGSTTPFASTSYFTYDNGALLLREQETTGDGTERLGSYLRYVRDLSLPGTGTDDATVAALRNLQQSGRGNTVLETLSFRRASPGAERMITGAGLSVYRTHSVQQIGGSMQNVALPHRSFGARMSQPQAFSTVFTSPTVTNVGGTNQLNAPSLYGYSLTAPDHRTEGSQLAYDVFGQPTRSRNRMGLVSEVRYGYNSTEAVASVVNGSFATGSISSPATASFCDAEVAIDGSLASDGWTLYTNAARTTTHAHTGKYSVYGPVNLGTASPTYNPIVTRHLNAEDQSATYVLSAWVRSEGTAVLSLRTTTSTQTTCGSYNEEPVSIPNTNGKWELFVARVDVNRARTEGSVCTANPVYLLAQLYTANNTSRTYVDDIRLHKLDATMTSATFLPLIGSDSASDSQSTCAYTEYDDLGRVVLVRDKDRGIRKQTKYIIKP